MPKPVYSREESPWKPWIGWMGPRAGLDVVAKGKSLLLAGIEHWSSNFPVPTL
jgi:hypothetical protein